MSWLGKVVRMVRSSRRAAPVGSIRVVDLSPLHWLSITYNTVEELGHVTPQGMNRPAAMTSFRWVDDTTLEVDLRPDNHFPEVETLTGSTVERAFNEVLRRKSPHSCGSQFNLDSRTRLEVVSERRFCVHLSDPDGLAVGRLRAVHLDEHAVLEWAQLRVCSPKFGGRGLVSDRRGEPVGHWSGCAG